jgi:hypothetical protein
MTLSACHKVITQKPCEVLRSNVSEYMASNGHQNLAHEKIIQTCLARNHEVLKVLQIEVFVIAGFKNGLGISVTQRRSNTYIQDFPEGISEKPYYNLEKLFF